MNRAGRSAVHLDGSPALSGSLPLTVEVDGAISLQLGTQCPLFFEGTIAEQADGGASSGTAGIESYPHRNGCLLSVPSGVLDFLAEGSLSANDGVLRIDLEAPSAWFAGAAQPAFFGFQLSFEAPREVN